MLPDSKNIKDIAFELSITSSLNENYGLYIFLENQYSLVKTRIDSL